MAGEAPIRARSDATDRLVEADEALAGLQRRCGGTMPGLVAIPALLALVRKARRTGLPLARSIVALDEGKLLSAWASVTPAEGGAAIELSQWRLEGDAAAEASAGEDLLRQLAEGLLLLNADQAVLATDLAAPDLAPLGRALAQGRGRPWTEFVEIEAMRTHWGERGRPLHWRLLDGAGLTVPGSPRRWRAHFLPQAGAAGVELLLLPEEIEALPFQTGTGPEREGRGPLSGLLGRDLAPALRQPITRIIANAETIRTRLAGPLSDEYATYAGDIAEAGRHLMGLVEDLADLEAVEAPGFSPEPDHIDLSDCARRAAGILAVRAQERAIALEAPPESVHTPAIGEFRRVLQVLLNLLSNAIRYTPPHTAVELECGTDGDVAWISVSDEGEGLTPEQAERVFDKFERLGRTGDGGSGLGLYISRKLARAMGGDLTVHSNARGGACFILRLPADRAEALSASG